MASGLGTVEAALRLLTIDADESVDNLNPIFGVDEAATLSFKEAVVKGQAASGLTPKQVKTVVFCATTAATIVARGPGGLGLLTADMAAAIHLYTQDTPFYEALNLKLRERARQQLKPLFPYVKLLLSALHRLPSETCTLYVLFSRPPSCRANCEGQQRFVPYPGWSNLHCALTRFLLSAGRRVHQLPGCQVGPRRQVPGGQTVCVVVCHLGHRERGGAQGLFGRFRSAVRASSSSASSSSALRSHRTACARVHGLVRHGRVRVGGWVHPHAHVSCVGCIVYTMHLCVRTSTPYAHAPRLALRAACSWFRHPCRSPYQCVGCVHACGVHWLVLQAGWCWCCCWAMLVNSLSGSLTPILLPLPPLPPLHAHPPRHARAGRCLRLK